MPNTPKGESRAGHRPTNQRCIQKPAVETTADPGWNHSQNSAQVANAKVANITASKIKWSSSDELIQDLHVWVINTEKKWQSITNSKFSALQYFTLSKCGRTKQMGDIITSNP